MKAMPKGEGDEARKVERIERGIRKKVLRGLIQRRGEQESLNRKNAGKKTY